MNEHGYIRAVHRKLPSDVWAWKIHTNFNNEVVDACYHRKGVKTLWAEYKYLKDLPKRPTTVIVPSLTSKQKKWLDTRAARGLLCSVIVGSPHGGVLFSPSQWAVGISTADFKNRVLSHQDVAAWIAATLEDEDGAYVTHG